MKKQRTTQNLGLNRASEREIVHDYLEKVLKLHEKHCGRGRNGRVNKFGQTHQGPNPLSIRNFNLNKAYVNPDGSVTLKTKTGLQSACIACDRDFRHGRSEENHRKYDPMTDEEVRANYVKEYGPTVGCSKCQKAKVPEEIRISRGMERGLHNICFVCEVLYGEAVGSRWVIYSPDGRNEVKKGAKCVACSQTEKLQKDHIWPLAKGGTDWEENIQFLCKKHNLEKSASVVGFSSLAVIKDRMICERYQKVLEKARKEQWSIQRFGEEMNRQVRKFLASKQAMSDAELEVFFTEEKRRSNRRHGIPRAVEKFREYQSVAILNTIKNTIRSD